MCGILVLFGIYCCDYGVIFDEFFGFYVDLVYLKCFGDFLYVGNCGLGSFVGIGFVDGVFIGDLFI